MTKKFRICSSEYTHVVAKRTCIRCLYMCRMKCAHPLMSPGSMLCAGTTQGEDREARAMFFALCRSHTIVGTGLPQRDNSILELLLR